MFYMDFRTTVTPTPHPGLIAHNRPMLMLGSCFTDNIGARLNDALFDVCINPFGTLYNPASVASAFSDVKACRAFGVEDLFEHQGRYHSFSHHSMYSGVDSTQVLDRINRSVAEAHDLLNRDAVVIVTFGTAYVFEKDGRVVSNCHKLPAATFNRRRMSVDEIVAIWSDILSHHKSMFVFTVSPIRHLADGAHDNQLSKSTLLLAVEQLCERFENAVYFPSYEIMMDDLRDYRFYASDMTHPSEVAVDYIYSGFARAMMTSDTCMLAQQCEKLARRLAHRFMTDDVQAIERFEQATNEMARQLLLSNPCLKRALERRNIKL